MLGWLQLRKRIKKNSWEYKIKQMEKYRYQWRQSSHLLVKRSRRRNEACTETGKDEMRNLKRRGVSACNVFLVLEQDT